MAIDTDSKKMSAKHFGWRHRILPVAVIAPADMQDLCGFYRGILAAAPAVIPPYMDVGISVTSYDVGITVTDYDVEISLV